MKLTGQVQLQARDGVQNVTASLDEETLKYLESTHKAISEVLGMEVSQTVVMRRALRDYWCHFIEGLMEREEKCKTAEDRLKFQAEWNSNERCRLAKAAGRPVTGKHESNRSLH